MTVDRLRRLPIPVALALVAAVSLVGGSIHHEAEGYVRFMVRETAYISSSFFLLAYLARPLSEWTGQAWATLLVQIRRRIGIAAALVHTVHFAVVVELLRSTGEAVGPTTLVFGGLGFLVFWLMALTSNDASVRVLGGNWKRLHRFGIHYLWLIFFQTYLGDVGRIPVYAGFLALFAAALALRVGLFVRSRRAVGA